MFVMAFDLVDLNELAETSSALYSSIPHPHQLHGIFFVALQVGE
jgi:hypothetical protein